MNAQSKTNNGALPSQHGQAESRSTLQHVQTGSKKEGVGNREQEEGSATMFSFVVQLCCRSSAFRIFMQVGQFTWAPRLRRVNSYV